MWLFTPHGFFSITRTRLNPSQMQIRARSRKHLENLQKHFTPDEGICLLGQILETPDADYRYRIIAEPATVQILLAKLAEEIDYPNFKNECHGKHPDDTKYHNALHEIWGTMYELQQNTGGRRYAYNIDSDWIDERGRALR